MSHFSLQLRYQDLVANAWAELPRLVSQYVGRAASRVQCSRGVLEDAVAESLDLPSFAAFESVCSLLSRIYPYLAGDQPEDHHYAAVADGEGVSDALGDEVRGQAWAALTAWRAGGWHTVAQLDWRKTSPLARVPYEQLTEPVDGSAPGDSARSTGGGAYSVLLRFLEEAVSLREQVLEGYVVCQSDALTQDGLEYVLDLSDVLARSIDLPVGALAAELLMARGIHGVGEDELTEMWDDASGFTPEDWAMLERLDDPGMDTHAERLERVDAGHPPVWQLRVACVAFSPLALGGYYDDSPTLYGALTQAPAEARFRINAVSEDPHDYLVPAIHFQGFVRTFDEISALLRCAPRMPARVEVVTHDDALEMGFAALAGWYKLDWSDCL